MSGREFGTTVRVSPGLHHYLVTCERAFVSSRDPMLALRVAEMASRHGAPLPPNIGLWLADALKAYVDNEAAAMDEAMGLAKRGQEQPRRKSRAAAATHAALASMWQLIGLGATREQAAVLVAARTGRSVDQLRRAYGASWFADQAVDPVEGLSVAEAHAHVVDELARFPDTAETAQEKAAILAKHPAPPPPIWQPWGWVAPPAF